MKIIFIFYACLILPVFSLDQYEAYREYVKTILPKIKNITNDYEALMVAKRSISYMKLYQKKDKFIP